jgi:hypothetical protein
LHALLKSDLPRFGFGPPAAATPVQTMAAQQAAEISISNRFNIVQAPGRA